MEMPNERLFVIHEIIKYGCSRIFIEQKHYRMYLQNFNKVRSTNRVGDDEILEAAKGIH